MVLQSHFLRNGVIILVFTILLPLSGFWPFSFKPPLASLGGLKTVCSNIHAFLVIGGSKLPTRFKLEDDSMCGVTTGGSDNCEWDCIPLGGGFYSNPECILDCFPKGHCVEKLLQDYLSVGGICGESSFGDQIKEILPTSSKDCEYITIPIGENNVPHNFTISGILKKETLDALYENENCIYDVHRKSSSVYGTISILVYTSSNILAIRNWFFLAAKKQL